ncbi:MAG: uncharacterized protein A8A55_2161 [Amphiamblys sp. WSBS2006]|nr:MAG: uncharacterized protein A8A55_2161 [Amphiamblys sp. WSBS2006]
MVEQGVLEGIEKKTRNVELRSTADAMCMLCNGEEDDEDTEVFLFPLCKGAHHFICLDCLDGMAGRENENKIMCSFCNEYATFAMDEYKKDLTQDSFCLRNPLPNRVVVLSEKTTVHLENVGISKKLLFALLTKTRISVRQPLSVFQHRDDEDCIKEHTVGRNSPVSLAGRYDGDMENRELFLKNIKGIPLGTITCRCKSIFLEHIYLALLLPKLLLHKENEMDEFYLSAGWKEFRGSIFNLNEEYLMYHQPDAKIYTGRVKKLKLIDYAVFLLPTLQLHKENNMEELYLSAEGRSFFDHADDAYRFFETIVSDRKGLFEAGKLEHLKLGCYAVIFLPFLRLKEKFLKSLEIVGVEEKLMAGKRKSMAGKALFHHCDFLSWKTRRMKLENSTIELLRVLRTEKSCVLEQFVLIPRKEEKNIKQSFFYPKYFDLGRIRQNGLYVPENIKSVLRYTLVDKEGKDVVEKKKSNNFLCFPN